MLGDERLQLGDELAFQSEGHVGVDPLLDGLQSQFLQRGDLPLRERLVGEVGQGGAAPQTQGLTERRGALGGLARPSLLE